MKELSPENEVMFILLIFQEILSSALGIYTELYELYTDQSGLDFSIVEKLIVFLNSKNPQVHKDLLDWSKYVFQEHRHNA